MATGAGIVALGAAMSGSGGESGASGASRSGGGGGGRVSPSAPMATSASMQRGPTVVNVAFNSPIDSRRAARELRGVLAVGA